MSIRLNAKKGEVVIVVVPKRGSKEKNLRLQSIFLLNVDQCVM